MAARRGCASPSPGREEGKKGKRGARSAWREAPLGERRGARPALGGFSGVCWTRTGGGGRAAWEEERSGKGGVGVGARPERALEVSGARAARDEQALGSWAPGVASAGAEGPSHPRTELRCGCRASPGTHLGVRSSHVLRQSPRV